MATQSEAIKKQGTRMMPVSKTVLILAAILGLALAAGILLARRPAVLPQTGLPASWQASAARYNGLAQAYKEQRRIQAEIGRLNGLAGLGGLDRGRKADAARLSARGQYYLSQHPELSRTWQAEAARWKALGEFYTSQK